MEYIFTLDPADARIVAGWYQTRGLRVWHSLNLADPARMWLTPADGKFAPHWSAGNPQDVTPDQIGVGVFQEVKRFHVAVRRGSNGLSWKLKDGSQRRLDKALDAAGEGSTYQFDYLTQEAVIFKQVSIVSLEEWLASNPLTV